MSYHVGKSCGTHAATSIKPWVATDLSVAGGGRHDPINAQCMAVTLRALAPAFVVAGGTASPQEYDEDADDGVDVLDEPQAKHKENILAIVDALKLPRDSEVTRGWIRIATGRGGGKGRGFAKKTHRRAL